MSNKIKFIEEDAFDEKPDQEGYEFNANETYHEVVFREEWKKHRSTEYFEYRKLWDDVPRTKTVLDYPMHLDIETTNICNLKCPMCPRTLQVDDGTFGELGQMTWPEYQNIIDQAVAMGVKSIKLNYLGEPLAHKQVVKQVAYAKEQGILDVMMNSNAALLTKTKAKALLEAGLDNMFVSFDAIDPELFADRRVGTSLGRVLDNVYNFVALRNADFPHVQIRLSMVMYKTQEWLEQFEGLRIMWQRIVDAIGYGFYVERDRNKHGDYPEIQDFWCAQPYQRMFLKYNGNVTICCVDDIDETVVGNWRKEDLFAVWNGEAYRKIREQHGEGNYYKMDMCRKCYLPHSD